MNKNIGTQTPQVEVDGFNFLMDIKFIAERYYAARVKEICKNSLVLEFKGGERFKLNIEKSA